MRDNKRANSTTYGGVQAGRCSKQPRRSLPYGVTNCCFFHCDREVHQKRWLKGEKYRSKTGTKVWLFWCCTEQLLSASKLSLKVVHFMVCGDFCNMAYLRNCLSWEKGKICQFYQTLKDTRYPIATSFSGKKTTIGYKILLNNKTPKLQPWEMRNKLRWHWFHLELSSGTKLVATYRNTAWYQSQGTHVYIILCSTYARNRFMFRLMNT